MKKAEVMLNIFIRTIILYLIVIVSLRIMGKRQIGQLQPFELVSAIMISELAAIPMENSNVPLLSGVIPILTLLTGQTVVSILTYKSQVFRRLFDGEASVLIKNGKIQTHELSKEMVSISDLLEQLRLKNYHYIEDIDFAILETNGDISIIPKADKIPPTMSDLNIPAQFKGMTIELIVDGKIIPKNLEKANITVETLEKLLKKQGMSSINKTLVAVTDSNNKIFAQELTKGG